MACKVMACKVMTCKKMTCKEMRVKDLLTGIQLSVGLAEADVGSFLELQGIIFSEIFKRNSKSVDSVYIKL